MCTTVGPVSDLVSMLVPLQTLPGWNNVENPSVLWILLLALGIPLAFGLLVTVVGMGPSWARSGRGEAELEEPIWLGAGAEPKALPTGGEKMTVVGGASDRW